MFKIHQYVHICVYAWVDDIYYDINYYVNYSYFILKNIYF